VDFPMRLWLNSATGYYYLVMTPAEAPPKGARVSLKKIMGHSVSDQAEAAEILAAVKRNWHKKKIIELERGRICSLERLAKVYTETAERKDLAADTLRMDRLAIRRLGDVCGHTKQVRSITKNDLANLKATLLATGLSPNTVATYFRHLRAAFNWAAQESYRQTQPVFPKVKTPRRLPRIIEVTDLDAIFDHLKEKDHRTWRYAMFSLWTGCRLSECVDLTWPRIRLYDESHQQVHGWATIVGKGDKERQVPLLEEAVCAMGDPADIGPVFAKHHPDTVSKWFHAAVVATGFSGKRYSFHSLRHTSATRMLQRGYRMTIIQQILGHVDIRTTQLYAAVMTTTIEDEINRYKEK